MDASRRLSIARLMIALITCLLPVFVARAQGEVGPQTVWQANQAAQTSLFNCLPSEGCTLSGIMAAHGATAEAIAFAQAHEDWNYLAAFTEMGRIDLGELWAPFSANSNRAYELLNGNPPSVDAQSARDEDAKTHPAYAPLYARYPDLILWGSDSIFEGLESRPDGGQRFIFRYPMVDGCHACDVIDIARVAYDFDAVGNYLGLTYLDPASAVAATPPSIDPNRPRRQIAYIDPDDENPWLGLGEIWLIDEDGANPQQLTSGDDCCLAWSPDGNLLYFLRNAKGKDSQSTSPSGIVMIYDFRSGEERVISTPEVNISDSLALSADGRQLAFSTSDWVDVEMFGNVHKGCLYVMAIDTGQATQVDCEAPGAIYDIAFSPVDGSISAELGFFEGSRPVIYDTPTSPRRFHDSICCSGFEYSADGTDLYTVGGSYGSMTSDLRLYRAGQTTPQILRTMDIENGIFSDPDLSPEGDRLVYSIGGTIEIMDVVSGSFFRLINGAKPVWRPDTITTGQIIDDLLARKEATFDLLETTTYTSFDDVIFPELIPAYDEAAARELVDSLRDETATISPEQAEALERLVMQEETLAVLLGHYSLLTDDQADVEADLAVLAGGTALLAAKTSFSPQWALNDLARKAVEDFIKVWLNFIEDQAIREAAQDGVDDLSLAFDAIQQDAPGLVEEFTERALSDQARAKAAAQLIPVIVAAGQPAIDQAVRSVRGESPSWMVEGGRESAALQLDGLVTQSTLMSDLAHNVYVDSLGRGREVNELVKDIADLLSIGSAGNPYAILASVQTRIQQMLIDAAASSVLSDAMTCTRDAAALTGEYAFRPSQQVFQCRVPVPLDLGDFFSRLFTERPGRFGRLSPRSQSLSPEFDSALVAYRAALGDLRDAVMASDVAAVTSAANDLASAAARLDAPAASAMARLDPTAEGADPTGQMALGVALTTVRIDAVLALTAADTYLADPTAADSDTFGVLLDTAMANSGLPAQVLAVAPLPPAPVAARPVVDTPAAWSTAAGKPLALPITVMNIGGTALEDGLLALELDGEVVAESALALLAPGASATVSTDFIPDAPGRFRFRVIAAGGDRPDYRTVDLTVAVIEATASEATAIAETATDFAPSAPEESIAVESEAPTAPIGAERVRSILLAVMIGAGALFVVALVAYLRSGRRS